MKKIAIILLALLPTMAGWSQDTLTDPFKDNYYNNFTPDLKENFYIEGLITLGHECGIQTKEMYAGETQLKIYGVAAAMMTPKDRLYIYPDADPAMVAQAWYWLMQTYGDTANLSEVYEYLGVYLRDADSVKAQRQVMVHRRYDTPAYYVAAGPIADNPNFIYPMYEKYFDTAIVVTDTFYVGTTQRSCQTTVPTCDHMSFDLMQIWGDACSDYCEVHFYKLCPDNMPGYVRWIRECSTLGYHEYYLIFPILTPEPEPGDTLAVTQADMMARYVSVQPNPAVKEARVLSSFGLTRIEAYDDRGRLVLAREASGLEAVLDIAAWPRGTYLLRIATPMGAVTKKLIVQ